MAEQSGTGPIDGVLEVDPVALRSLLEVIGPVELDGVEYTAENIEAKVLYENYLSFDTVAERGGRQERQGEIAKAIFDALEDPGHRHRRPRPGPAQGRRGPAPHGLVPRRRRCSGSGARWAPPASSRRPG